MDILDQSKNIYTCFFTLIVLLLIGCNSDPYTSDIYNWKKKLFESVIDIFTPKISSPKQTSIEQKEIEKLQAELDKRIIIIDDDCCVFFFCLPGNLWHNKTTTGSVYNSLQFCWRYEVSINFILVTYI